jgi:hypothetical protein
MAERDEIDVDDAKRAYEKAKLLRAIRRVKEEDLENGPPYERPGENMPDKNGWAKMKEAEWRGKIGEKLDRLETMVAAVCSKVDTHDTDLAIIKDRGVRSSIGWRGWSGIITAIILSLGGIAVALIK